jgi:MSHA biogenesis protein MshP
MRCHRPRQGARQGARGFALIAAIFLLVIVAGMAAYAVNMSANSAAGSALSVQSARAYQSARAGIEWAAYQVKDPNGTLAPGATNLPDCFTSTPLSLPAVMGGFTVTVTCTRYPAIGASPNYHEEGSQRLAFYVIDSIATSGVAGRTDYAERKIQARIEKCKDPNSSNTTTYACL